MVNVLDVGALHGPGGAVHGPSSCFRICGDETAAVVVSVVAVMTASYLGPCLSWIAERHVHRVNTARRQLNVPWLKL